MSNRPVKACTECKQVKIRCNAKETFPSSCSRCQTRNLVCTVDASFKRTPVRQRVKEMADELKRTKESMAQRDIPELNRSGTTSSALQSPDYVNIEPSQIFTFEDPDIPMQNAVLGSVVLTNEEISESFSLFTHHFYNHLPILDVRMTIPFMYQHQPLLFWTIMIITRRAYPSQTNLPQELKDAYAGLLTKEILNVPVSLSTTQALLYLCMWPLPVKTQLDDPSWLYCGIIFSSALYMGLSRPDTQEPLRSIGVVASDLQTRIRTWTGYFLVSTSLSLLLGVPPTVRTAADLGNIEKMLIEHPVPPEFAAQVVIQTQMAKYVEFLSSHGEHTSGSAVVQLFEGELNSTKTRFAGHWTSRLEYNLLVAKLHLYTNTLIKESQSKLHRNGSSGSHELPRSANLLLHLSLAAAVRIISLFNDDMAYYRDRVPNNFATFIQATIPKYYMRALAFATFFLLRYFALNSSASAEDRQLARNQVTVAYSHFKRCSQNPKDEPGRIVTLLEVLSRKTPQDLDKEALRTNTRMSASVTHDMVSTSFELRNRPIHMEPIPTQEPSGSDMGLSNPSILDLFDPDSVAMNEFTWDVDLTNEFWNDPLGGVLGPIG